MIHRRSRSLVLAAVAAGLVMLSGCGAPAEEQPEAAAHENMDHGNMDHGDMDHGNMGQGEPQAPQQGHHHGGGLQLWATQTPTLGIVALDGAGRILYRSDADGNNPPVSHCTGECAQRWAPVTLPDGQEPDLLGVKPEHFGTIRREDGTQQVTLAGWPLYTVAGDTGSHDDTGANGAEGIWFAVTPTGEKATP